MRKLALAPLALALLAGCATEDRVTAAPPPVVVAPAPAPVALRPGVGVVASIESVPASAAAGGGAGSSSKRVAVRMADNSMQSFDTRAVGLRVGERVEITPDGYLRHPVP